MSSSIEEISNITLENELWKDSFDRLLEDKHDLREKNVIKKNVRASFNMNSSLDDTVDNKKSANNKKLKERVNKQKQEINCNNAKKTKCTGRGRGRPKKKNINLLTANLNKSQISTPIGKTNQFDPFDCNLSPISDKWTFTYFNQKSSLAKQIFKKNTTNKLNKILCKSNDEIVTNILDQVKKPVSKIPVPDSISTNTMEPLPNNTIAQTDQISCENNSDPQNGCLSDNGVHNTVELLQLSECPDNQLVISNFNESLDVQILENTLNICDHMKSIYLVEQNSQKVHQLLEEHTINTSSCSMEVKTGCTNSPQSKCLSEISKEIVTFSPAPSIDLCSSYLTCEPPSSLPNNLESDIINMETLQESTYPVEIKIHSLDQPVKDLSLINTITNTNLKAMDKQMNESSNNIIDLTSTPMINYQIVNSNNVTKRKTRERVTFKKMSLDNIAEECSVIEESFFKPRTSVIAERKMARLNSGQVRRTTKRGSRSSNYLRSLPEITESIKNLNDINDKALSIYSKSNLNKSPKIIVDLCTSFDNCKELSNMQQQPSSSHNQSNPQKTINFSSITFGERNYTNGADISLRIPAGKWKRTLSLKRREMSMIVQLNANEIQDKTVKDSRVLDQSLVPVYRRRTSVYIGRCRSKTYSLQNTLTKDPKTLVLERCNQKDSIKFSEAYSSRLLKNCRKIGEGAYGEVFLNRNENGKDLVLKVIPIEGDYEVNGESQKTFLEILSEIIISIELSNLRTDRKYCTDGFVGVNRVQCVKGRYPSHLVDLWELYRDNGNTENDHPKIFKESQIFIVLELENAGKDLEAFVFHNAEQSYSAFIQIASSLAVAEKKFQFEHRDLHWGNVLLQTTTDKMIEFKLDGDSLKLQSFGIKATIIDYTLSRLSLQNHCLFNDLSKDEELFSAEGDYQFEIYRLMKSKIQNKWEEFEPYTNVLWLHYIAHKMINAVRYRSTKTKKHKAFMEILKKEADKLLQFSSAYDYVVSLKNVNTIFE